MSELPAPMPVGSACDWLDADFSHVFQDPGLPSHLREVFAGIVTWWDTGACVAPEAIHVYTDGAATQDPALFARFQHQCTWAFTVWFQVGADSLLYGCAAHSSVQPSSPYYLGERDETSLTAERLAICWALAWAADSAAAYHAPLVLHYDCLAAGLHAFGEARSNVGAPSSDHVHLTRAVTVLRQIAGRAVPISHRHVPSHAGYVGNELTDRLAKLARCQYEADDARCLPAWPARVVGHELADWAWAVHDPGPDLPTLYAFESEAFRLQALDFPAVVPPSPVSPVHERASSVVMRLTFASYNVLSLLEDKHCGQRRASGHAGAPAAVGLKVIGKRELLKTQLVAEAILLTGLQETRLPGDDVKPDSHFFMFHSSCQRKGHHGVALWASRVTPYGHDAEGPLFFAPEHFTVLQHSSRHLLARICAPYLRLQVLVAHAPHSRCEAEDAVRCLLWRGS